MLFIKLFGTALAQPTLAGAAILTSAENWLSRFNTELSLEESLLLELEFGLFVERRRRKAGAALTIIYEPQPE